MGDILTGTPPELTYQHPMVREAWGVVWAIVSGALVVILGWIGLNLIVGEHLGTPQAGWREIVPRLVLGLVAAATSLWWCALVIDVSAAVSGFIAVSLEVTPGDLARAPLGTLLASVQAGSVGMAILLALLYLVYGFFVLYVVVQMMLRLALLDLLLILAPMALGLWILPHTSGWGRHWLKLFMTTAFQQSVQLIALALAFGFLKEYASFAALEPVRDAVWKLLMSLAFIYLASRVPSMLGATRAFDTWLNTLYFGMSIPGSMYRAVGTMGRLWSAGATGGATELASGGAAAGAAGAAAGVVTAGAGLAAGAVRSAADIATPSGGGQSGVAPRSEGE